ncbi:MAG: hypothetical protein ACRCYW_14455, partial [Aeromonas sp.]|uniref:hypothetical protein n=1 Tax=Aeromonas sp. TaxID=647 RepID=UPI003F3BB70E
YTPVTDTFITAANGEAMPVAGQGTVRLLLGDKIVEEHGWLHLPGLAMRLKSVRMHRRLHPDAFFLASNEEVILGYPTFNLHIDDKEDVVLPCSPAPPGSNPDFISSLLVGPTDELTFQGAPATNTPGFGYSFQGTGGGPRRFLPFSQNHDTSSTRDVPSQYVPDSGSPSKRFTDNELHKLFGNRTFCDWSVLTKACEGGSVVNLKEKPISIGDLVNIRRNRRGKKAQIPPPGHTICVDMGYGDGVSPGGHQYALVIIDAGSRQCWSYGLRDKSGATLAAAFQQYFADIGPDRTSQLVRMLTDFDTSLIRGDVKWLLLSKGIKTLSSVPYRHSQNGLVERHWVTAVRMARSYLQEANLPRRFWFWALRTAFERMNVIPLEVDHPDHDGPLYITPFELYYGQMPDLCTLFPFGS